MSYSKSGLNRKKEFFKKHGSKCAHCGSVDKLEIDHIDPKTKLYKPSDVVNRSPEVCAIELSKCQLLCRPCHIKKSVEERGSVFLNQSSIDYIFQLAIEGYGYKRTARLLGLSWQNVRNVRKGRSYLWLSGKYLHLYNVSCSQYT